MATTSPLGGFADLSAYTPDAIARRARQPGVLDALIGGLQQGVQLQQLPQNLQNQQLAAQVARELQLAKLNELQNPELGLQRRLQEQAIEAILTGRNPSVIFEPQVSPEIAAMRQIAETQAGVPSTVSDFQPIVPAARGFPAVGISPSAGLDAEKRKNDAKLAQDAARYRDLGIPTRLGVDEFGNNVLIPTRVFPGQAATTIPVVGPEGAPLKAPVKSTTVKSLTPNAQTTLLSQASAVGLDPDDPKYLDEETGTYDFVKIAIDKGKAAREGKRLENAVKAESLTGKTKTDIEALNAAEKQLHFLQDEIERVAASGKTPGFLDNVIAAGTATPPSGYIGGIVQQLAKGLQSEESKELEGRKTIITSALRKAISGLAVTNQEATALGFLPRAGDSFQELVRKSGVLEEYINNQREGLGGGSPNVPRGTQQPNSKSIKVGRFTVTPQ